MQLQSCSLFPHEKEKPGECATLPPNFTALLTLMATAQKLQDCSGLKTIPNPCNSVWNSHSRAKLGAAENTGTGL